MVSFTSNYIFAQAKRKQHHMAAAVNELNLTADILTVWTDVIKQPSRDPHDLSPPNGR